MYLMSYYKTWKYPHHLFQAFNQKTIKKKNIDFRKMALYRMLFIRPLLALFNSSMMHWEPMT